MKKEFTFADLCAGIGGFRLALESIGGHCVYSSEIDNDCEKTYYANFKEKFNSKDINAINSIEFPHVDILCAGFPCQPFSIAGNRGGFDDPRGKIFFKLAELIEYSHPKVVFFENVTNLVRIDKGLVFKNIISILDKIGYRIFYDILDSSKFGIPQVRKRVYIIAVQKEMSLKEFHFSIPQCALKNFKSIIEYGDYSIPISPKWEQYIDYYTGKINADDLNFRLPKTRKSLERIDQDIDLNNCVFQIRSSGIRALSIDKPLPTFAVSVSGGGAMIPVYSKERRHLNLLEMKRLMGFPDNFHFPVSRTSAIKQLANTICPPVIASIGKDIITQIDI